MEKKSYFILLRDLEDPSSQASGMLWGMLSNYVYGTSPPIALKGELFEALPADEQPVGIEDKIALRGLKQKCLNVECPKEDLQVITEDDAQILLAVQSYNERCRLLIERQELLRWGVTENEGSQVLVWMDDMKKNVAAVVHSKGALPPYDGIMFGVEIVDPRFRNRGTTDGLFRCQRYFRCAPGAGLFVSLDKLTLPLDETDDSVKESVQDDYTCIEEDEIRPSGEDSGMECSEHSLMEAELLQEKSEALILGEKKTDDSETNGKDEECEKHECDNDNLLKEKKLSEIEGEDFKQLYYKEKKLLQEAQYRLKESKFRISSLEKRLDEELTLREKRAEKCNALHRDLSEEALLRAEAESLLEEERSKIRKMQKRFDREWAEFERRLIEERATKSDMERQLNDLTRQIEEERNAKITLQRALETLQERIRLQGEFEQQRQQQQQDIVVHSEARGDEPQPDLESRDWIISRDEVEVSEERSLGTGGWGVVKEGKFRGCQVAVKQIHELILSPHNRRLFMREMGIASRCRHPCLLQFIGATNDDGIPLFITELMDTSLRDLLEKQPLEKANIVTIALDVTRALNYLHLNRPPIIHRDISSANVLLWRRDNQWRAKVADYGTANFMRQCRTINSGAVIYSAPEALSQEQSPKIDVYSFGLLLCEMCIRELPVPHQTQDQISLIKDRVFKDLVTSCVRQDPVERPNMAEVISELEKLEQKN
ncbi:uncharacterized protein LOC144651443 isoform X2 [Oculina patagonica]